jgi:hypothetical protein
MINLSTFGIWEFYCNIFLFTFYFIRYEMICGYTPFASENPEIMYNLIRLSDVKFMRKLNVSIHLQNLILGVI